MSTLAVPAKHNVQIIKVLTHLTLRNTESFRKKKAVNNHSDSNTASEKRGLHFQNPSQQRSYSSHAETDLFIHSVNMGIYAVNFPVGKAKQCSLLFLNLQQILIICHSWLKQWTACPGLCCLFWLKFINH